MTHEGNPRGPDHRGEYVKRHPETVFLNEFTHGNVFSEPHRVFPLIPVVSNFTFSREGFAQSEIMQQLAADFYINALDLEKRGPFLDVGMGENIHIASRFAQRGIPAYGLDFVQEGDTKPDSIGDVWLSPHHFSENLGVRLLSGDISRAKADDSVIKDIAFGSVIFNGSWDSGGYNNTVGKRLLEGKYGLLQIAEPFYDFREQERDTIFQSSRSLLAQNGILGVTSSRYAFRGAGFEYEEYPDEKLSFLCVYKRMLDLGATRFYIAGVSQSGFDDLLQQSIEATGQVAIDSAYDSTESIWKIRRQLSDPRSIDLEEQASYLDESPALDREVERWEQAVRAAQQNPQLHNIARIDAIFAEFPEAA